MSAPLSSLSGAVPAIDYANEPQSVRQGGAAAKQAYAEGLGFESVLLNQLTQQLTATISGSSDPMDSGSDGSGGSDGSSGSDPAAGAYSSMLPQALTQGIMAGGGTGLAMQLAESIDPALGLGAKR